VSISFPTLLDTFDTVTGTTRTDTGVPHAALHMTELAVLFALEAKVGIDGSSVVTSIDWKLADARTRMTTAEAAIVTNASAIAAEATARAAADSTINTALASKADLVAGVVPSSQLPSYVDDVLEFTNFAAFPGTGETGKIYIDKATNTQYRWSGSVYIELVASPGTTDAVTEGTTNLYFTVARVLAVVLAGLSTATNAVITSADTVLGALGKLQAQLSAMATTLAGKLTANTAITGATKTKISYDVNGLVTSGADATTADIADSTNRRYVTDAQQAVIGNTSGTNTGDQTNISGNAATATKLATPRNINGQPFDGSADITIATGGGGGGSISVFFP